MSVNGSILHAWFSRDYALVSCTKPLPPQLYIQSWGESGLAHEINHAHGNMMYLVSDRVKLYSDVTPTTSKFDSIKN